MTKLKRTLLAAAIIACLASAGAFAQKQGEDKRPPKEGGRVVVQPKGDKEKPPQNSNQGGKKPDDKKGKP